MKRSKTLTRGLAGAGLAALLVGAGIQLQGRAQDGSLESPSKINVGDKAPEGAGDLILMEPETLELAQLKIDRVQSQPMRERLEVTGAVEPDASAVVRVTPRLSGRVLSVSANLGDLVSAGQVLVGLASSELAEAQAQYHHTHHRRERARRNLERQRKLARLGFFGRPRVEDARSRSSAGQGAVAIAQKELSAAGSQVAEARSELAALQGELASGDAQVSRARSDLAEAEAGVRAAQAALSQTRTAQTLAQSRFERYEILLKEELVSRQDWEQAQAEHRKAQADVDVARANVARAEAQVVSQRAAIQAAQAGVSAARARARQGEAKISTGEAREAECAARLDAAKRASEIAVQTATREEAVFQGAYLTSKEILDAEAELLEAEHDEEAAVIRVRLLGGSPGQGNQVAITAPIAGRLTERQVTLGEMVTPERALFTLVNLRSVWVHLNVYQQDLSRVRIGDTVKVTTNAAPGRAFQGKVAHVGDQVDESTRTVKVRCVIPNPDELLRPSLYVRGTLTGRAAASQLTLPVEAVQELDGRSVVFVPTSRPGEFRPREVRLGLKRGGRAVVLSGLQSGERVVTANALLLKAQTLKGEGQE